MDERASARFVAETHRQLTAAGFFIPRQLTVEGAFRFLNVLFSPIKCVNTNFLSFLSMLGLINGQLCNINWTHTIPDALIFVVLNDIKKYIYKQISCACASSFYFW